MTNHSSLVELGVTGWDIREWSPYNHKEDQVDERSREFTYCGLFYTTNPNSHESILEQWYVIFVLTTVIFVLCPPNS